MAFESLLIVPRLAFDLFSITLPVLSSSHADSFLFFFFFFAPGLWHPFLSVLGVGVRGAADLLPHFFQVSAQLSPNQNSLS